VGAAYGSKAYRGMCQGDVDAMLIFRHRAGMLRFIQAPPGGSLERSLGLDAGSVHPFTADEIRFFMAKGLEILRVSGSVGHVKTTVKLADFETLGTERIPSRHRVLSKSKDKRIYPYIDAWGARGLRLLVNKTVDLAKDRSYVILDQNFYQTGRAHALGLISDFLITAQCIGGDQRRFTQLQREYRMALLRLFGAQVNLRRVTDWSCYFYGGPRFSNEFKASLNADLSALSRTCPSVPRASGGREVRCRPYLVDIDPELFRDPGCWKPFKYRAPVLPPPGALDPTISREQVSQVLTQDFPVATGAKLRSVRFFEACERVHSSNPLSGEIDTDQGLFFFKAKRANDPLSVVREVSALPNLTQLYDRLVVPVYWPPDYCLFVSPWIPGPVEADALTAPAYREEVLGVELRRAEANLVANLSSLRSVQDVDSREEGIHRLYFKRLVGQRYRDYFHGRAMRLGGAWLPFERVARLTPVINGVRHRSLGAILDSAKRYLNPELLNARLKVYGLGDHHAGNVILRGDGDFAVLDYEYAGVQHPAQDCAKTICNDVYSEILFPKTGSIRSEPPTSARVQGEEFFINHSFCLSSEKMALLEIKLQAVLFPTLEGAWRLGLETADWEEILRASLVAAVLLNKSILDYPEEQLWAALALAIHLGTPGISEEGGFGFNRLLYRHVPKVLMPSRFPPLRIAS